ncbi:hypothetical protein ACJJIX_08430 [Microbulbifer sp. VAAC004]|uniref:hypothetical protein n=1 Tax=unclassified Microbulbifer TaxID=2619833 RepID=UPI004039C680
MRDLNSLIGPYAWSLFIASGEQVTLVDPEATVSIYGEGDLSYLVIEVYIGEAEVIQYMLDDTTENQPLKKILKYIEKLDYNINKIIKNLSAIQYTDSDIGDVCNIDGLQISRKKIS